jgi:hypothetical protein
MQYIPYIHTSTQPKIQINHFFDKKNIDPDIAIAKDSIRLVDPDDLFS